jgi:hypothetical protein
MLAERCASSGGQGKRFVEGVFSETQAVGSKHLPCTVRTDNVPKGRFSSTLGEGLEVEVRLD